MDGYVYMSAGTGMERVYVGENTALQESSGQCAPCWFTPAEHQYSGYVTALASDQGWLCAAVYNEPTQRGAIWYGVDRQKVQIASPNPLIWHGPEIVANQDLYVQKMKVSSLGANGGMRLWIASAPFAAPGAPWLGYVSVPVVGTPLSDLTSGGLHRFATGSGSGAWNANSSFRSLPLTWKDKNSPKFINDVSVGTRLPSVSVDGTKITTWLRADPPPGSVSYSGPVDATTGPSATYTPALTTAGYKIDYRADLISPNGGATPAKVAVLDAMRLTAWRIVPSFLVMTLELEFGDGVLNLGGAADETFSPDQIRTYLKNMALAGRTTMRLPDDSRYTIHFRQALDSVATITGGPYGRRFRTRVQVAVLAAL
jgi:hypothetical protein